MLACHWHCIEMQYWKDMVSLFARMIQLPLKPTSRLIVPRHPRAGAREISDSSNLRSQFGSGCPRRLRRLSRRENKGHHDNLQFLHVQRNPVRVQHIPPTKISHLGEHICPRLPHWKSVPLCKDVDENLPNEKEAVASGVQGEMRGVDGTAPGQAPLLSGGTKGGNET